MSSLLTTRWLAVLLFSLSLLLSTTWAADKNLVPTSASSVFPECGLSCSILQQAQDSCTASAAASTWFSCFCESALLTTLKTSGSICSNCGASDQALVSTWYNNYCSSGGTYDAGSGNGASSSAASSAATSSATAGSSTTSTTDVKPSWWSTHYQWVIMLIVLVLGFSAVAILGVWLKRRYDAKRPGLYHGGSAAASSSGVLGGSSGVAGTPLNAAWASPHVPNQRRNVVPESVASSSRTDIAPKGIPAVGSRSRLQKVSQSPADVEVRQISRQ